ncbi:MAG TPA: hypothetical protein DHM37_04110 [Candidatus Cloacimonas sp.]|nr:hypothetical protein [Candidatus Cloacimonas sp.]
MFKIVSGGQSGVDRAALDFAIENNIEYGGYVPKGFKSEDNGLTKEKYPNMVESKSSDYKVRTEENVINSDGTLIIYKSLSGGTKLTVKYAEKHNKPYLLIKMSDDIKEKANAIKTFLEDNNIEVLNVAGNRGSKVPDIYDYTKILLATSLTK